MRSVPLLIVAGVSAIVVAGLWFWLSAPPPGDVRLARIACNMRDRADCVVPAREIAGPIVLAIAGAFLVLIGTIVYSSRPSR